MNFLDIVTNPKVQVALLVVGAGVGGFLFGKGNVQYEILEKEKIVIVEHEKLKVVEVEKIIIEKAKDTALAAHIHKERTEETRPDGTKIVKETTDTNIDKTIKETEVKFVDRTTVVEKEKIVEKKIETIREVSTKLPDWTVTARLGTTFTELKPSLTVPYFSPIVIGAEVDRRIIGPVKAGLWVQTTTTLDYVTGGIAVGVEF